MKSLRVAEAPESAHNAEMTRAGHAEPSAVAADVRFDGVSFRYPGADEDAVSGVAIGVRAGEHLGIVGPNGGGKSTLLKIMVGVLDAGAGAVRVAGRTPDEARRSGLVAYVPQRSEAGLDWPVSVRQAVGLPLAARRTGFARAGAGERAGVDESLEVVGITDLARRRVGALSGGQYQRAMIARAVASGASVLALDEPTVGVDAEGQQRFSDLMARLRERVGLTVVIVSHDLRAIAAGCDRVACLARTLHYHDAPSGLTPQVLAEVFRHDVEGVFGAVHVDAHEAEGCDDPTHEHHDGEREG